MQQTTKTQIAMAICGVTSQTWQLIRAPPELTVGRGFRLVGASP